MQNNESRVPARRRQNGLAVRDTQFKKDRELKQNLADLKKCREDFKNLSDWLINTLDLPVNKNKRRLAKFCQRILPAKTYKVLPEIVGRWISEEINAADMVEGMLRENVINLQDIVQRLAESAIQEEELLKEFAKDIQTAESEGWSVRELQEYLCEKTSLPVPQGVEELLNDYHNVLSEEQKDKKKKELLSRLKSNAIGRKRLIEAHGKVCALGLEVWHAGVCQYFDYSTIIQPLKVISEAAEGMADMNTVAYAAKELVRKILMLSSETLGYVAEATSKMHEYAVSGDDTVSLMENVAKDLDGHIKKIEKSQNKIIDLEIEKNRILCPVQEIG